VLLRADVTRNDADDQALLKRFRIFGPPTIAFYGDDGQERSGYRVVGYMKPADFARTLRAALATARQAASQAPSS
jgi:thiol:disulfide interchange protein DsbD